MLAVAGLLQFPSYLGPLGLNCFATVGHLDLKKFLSKSKPTSSNENDIRMEMGPIGQERTA